MTPTDSDRQAAEKIAGEAELEVMAFRSQDPEALDRLNAAMIQLRTDIAQLVADARAVKKDHVRTPMGTEVHLWSTIRSSLTYCRDDLARLRDANDYETESAVFDNIARTITSHMIGDIRKQIEAAEAALAERGEK